MAINLKSDPRFGNRDSRLLERDPIISNAPNSPHIGHDFITDKTQYGKIEEKVAHLSLQINQVIVKPYLQQALDYLKNSKLDATNAYNQLSDQIANEVKIISQNTNIISDRLKQTQEVIAKTQEAIRNKYNNATEEEISSCELNLDYEYNIIAEHYELSLQLTQELSKYKSRIDTLLSSQNLLDESMVPAVSRIQLEIDNLELLLHGFDSSDYANLLAKKQGRTATPKIRTTPALKTRGPALNNLVEHQQMNSYQQFNNIPRIESMNRFEDPINQELELKRYGIGNYNLNSPGAQKEQAYYRDVRTTHQNYNNTAGQNMPPEYYPAGNNNPYNGPRNGGDYVIPSAYNPNDMQSVPLSRREQKMQHKLRRSEVELQRLKAMQDQYNRNLEAMQSMRADILAKEQETNRVMQMKDFSRVQQEPSQQYPQNNYNGNLASSNANQVYEARIPLETIDENMAKSPRDKIFVVRSAEPISADDANKLARANVDKRLRTIKVIK